MVRTFLTLAALSCVAAACVCVGKARQTSYAVSTERDLIFSHRKHLQRPGTGCADCHELALMSTSAAETLVPLERTCLRCHNGARAPQDCALCHKAPDRARSTAPERRSFRFNHKLHLGFGNIAPALARAVDGGRYLGLPGDMRRHLNSDNPCLACHRGVAETDLATSQHLPRMADCLVCHSKVDPPFSCTYCHTEDARLKPASHTSGFVDLHSNHRAVPDKTACKVCHGVKFTCMGCH